MIICCTQRAAREFGFAPSQLEPVISDGQDQKNIWFAHVFFIGRLKCLVLTHNASLFSAIKEGYKRIDMASPEELVKSMIGEALYHVGAPPEVIKKGLSDVQEIDYAKATDRRVLGSMNDMIKIYKYERDPRYPSGWDYPTAICRINGMPMKMVKYGLPAEVFIRGLGFNYSKKEYNKL